MAVAIGHPHAAVIGEGDGSSSAVARRWQSGGSRSSPRRAASLLALVGRLFVFSLKLNLSRLVALMPG